MNIWSITEEKRVMIIQISFLNEINEGLSVPRKTNLCTFSAEWFSLSLFILSLSLRTGKTTMIQGVVLLVVFSVYLFITIVP